MVAQLQSMLIKAFGQQTT